MPVQLPTDPSLTTARLEFAWECITMAQWLMNQSDVMTAKTNGDFHRIFSFLKKYVKDKDIT